MAIPKHPVVRRFCCFYLKPEKHTDTHTQLGSCRSKPPAPGITRPSPISNIPPPLTKLVVHPFTFAKPSFHLPGLSHLMILEAGSQWQQSDFTANLFNNSSYISLSFWNIQQNWRLTSEKYYFRRKSLPVTATLFCWILKLPYFMIFNTRFWK